jgi:acetyl esterase/lipase
MSTVATQGTRRTVRYGDHPRQYLEVFDDFAAASSSAAVLFVHGGFWRDEKDANSLYPICADLARRGVIAASIEYRSIEFGGTWPHCLTDVSRALDAFCATTGIRPAQTILAGHSAGGHLALMTAATRHDIGGVVGLAAISDLIGAYNEELGDSAVCGLFDMPQCPEARLLRASPAHHAQPSCRALLIHGDADTVVPLKQSRTYCAEVLRKGGCARLIRIPEATHMHLVNPQDRCWPAVQREILRLAWGNLTAHIAEVDGRSPLCQLCPTMPGLCHLEDGSGQACCRSDWQSPC